MKFNKNKEINFDRNLAGGKAFKPDSPKLALYKLTINNLLENKYYESDQESFNKICGAFEETVKKDPLFPLKLAEYARHKMYLRDVSQLLLVLSANNSVSRKYVQKYAPKIIARADELCTVISIQLNFFSQSIPNCLKKGVADACFNFKRYHYAKYFRPNKEVDFRDVLNLCHPNPKSELAQETEADYEEIFERLIKGNLSDYPNVQTLNPPKTWEVIISEKGNNQSAWMEAKENMGLFATIRNARNMREVGLNGKEIFGDIDEEWIENSKIYPFRFYQSYRALKEVSLLDQYSAEFLENAIKISLKNVPDYLGNSLVAVDLSGSMDAKLSQRSTISYREIASLFGAIGAKKGGEVWGFGNEAQKAPLDPYLNPVLTLQQEVGNMSVGHSTNGYKVIKQNYGNQFDRIIFFTDMQLWDSETWGTDYSLKECFDKYRSDYPETYLYMIDLASYGSLQTPEGYQNVFNVSGWNDKVLDFIRYAEKPNEILSKIEGE